MVPSNELGPAPGAGIPGEVPQQIRVVVLRFRRQVRALDESGDEVFQCSWSYLGYHFSFLQSALAIITPGVGILATTINFFKPWALLESFSLF